MDNKTYPITYDGRKLTFVEINHPIVMTCHITSHNMWHIVFSTILLLNCQLTSSSSLLLQPMTQTCEASIVEARASEFSTLIGFTILLNII